MKINILESENENVFKYIFTKEDAILEAVAYRYPTFEDRTVICCSIQSGCAVGCQFCGTGNRFIRDLTDEEILEQIDFILKEKKIDHTKVKKFQIMFMSMGEPMLNLENVVIAIRKLSDKYPTAELLVSTVGIKGNDDPKGLLLNCSTIFDKVGLQFSVHESTDDKRDKLIPFKNKMNLEEIRDFGIEFLERTGRKPFINYCVTDQNNTEEDFNNLKKLFSRDVFNLTFSVVCTADETMANAWDNQIDKVKEFTDKFVQEGYDVRTFNPAGQDTTGSGCGQLWAVQEWMKNHE